jgi:uncharacterized protein (DUF927 family)
MLSKQYKRDYFAEAHQLLKQQGYKSYIPKLLPAGRYQGNEYVVKNPTRSDGKAGSFSINAITGKWSDFATDDVGSDLISLTAYIKGISNIEACFYIGVPRPENNKPKGTIAEFPKPFVTTKTNITDNDILKATQVKSSPTKSEEDVEIEYRPEKTREALTALNYNIEQEVSQPTGIEGQELLEPPVITAQDTYFHNTRTFNSEPSNFFCYKSSLGVVVGYIARWEVKKASGESKKEVRPYIYNFEKKRWECKFFGQSIDNSRPLYNLPEIIARSDATVMIVEGEKTAEAAKLLFPEFVITTSSGGANQAKKTDWTHLRDRDIIFSPDDGEAGGKYLIDVEKQLRNVRAKINQILEPSKLSRYVVQDGIIVARQNAVPKGYDLADALADGWTADLIKEAQQDKVFEPFFKKLPKPQVLCEELKSNEELYELGGRTFKLTPSGLYLRYLATASAEDLGNHPEHEYDEYDHLLGIPKEAWFPLCGYLKPTYQITDVDNSWGMLVKFKNINDFEQETFLKRTDWLGEKGAVEILQDRGLHLRGLKKKNFELINEYLNEFKPEFKAIGVDMVGWQGDNEAYMLPFANEPRNNYSNKQEDNKLVEYILQQKGATPRVLKKKGTLEEWKRTVGQVCRGNHLHSFAILVSLAAPALKLLGEEGGFFHYVGNTSIGKSTILHVTKSVWGFDNLGSFRTTDNALESVCKNSNDGVLFLDEIGEIDPDAFFKIIYMLANGVTKGRSDRNGNAKNTTHFTVLAQSTGEIGLEAKLAEKKIQVKGGLLMRMAELDADRGKGFNTFDVLNINPDTGELFSTGREQAEYLKTNASKNCGVVIDSFLKAVVPKIEDYKEGLKKAKAKWLEHKLTNNEGAEVSRMAKRFSTIFATGVIAAQLGIIPHSFAEVEECVDTMFTNWLERFGGDNPHEFRMMVADLRKLTIENQYSRFQNAHPTEEERENLPKDKAGYWKMEKVKDEDGKMIWVLSEFWMYPKVFEREVLKGRDKKAFYPLLVESGYIKKGAGKGYTQSRRPEKGNSQHFIIVPTFAFTDENE